MKPLVELVLGDLAVGCTETPTVSITPLDGQDGMIEVLLTDDTGVGAGFGVDPRQRDAEILCALADRIPDAYADLFAVGLPLVPGTQRPAQAALVDGVAVWEDPVGGPWSCPVGRYRSSL